MKKLILVRHAKSSWEFNVIDQERPLLQRGIDDANKVSNQLKGKDLPIDYILCSDATRTKSTAAIFIKVLSLNHVELEFNHDLYDFSGHNLVNIIKSCDASVNHLMVFGHNHAITYFVNAFGNTFIDNVPTCGVVTIEFDIDNWNDLNKGKTVTTLFPRDLKS